jgi:NTE family protein
MTKKVLAHVYSGGGSRGDYHIGFVRRRAELGDDPQVVTGVSVGALVAAFIAQYPVGQFPEAAKNLETLFDSVETSDIWKRWFPFGKLHGIHKPSFLNSEPLRELIDEKLDARAVNKSNRWLRIGATSLTSGQYKIFGGDFVPLKKAVEASAAFPAMFRPVRIGGEWYTDGGVRTVTPIQSAIDAGATHIHVCMTGPPNPSLEFDSDPSGIDVAFRAIDLMSEEIVAKDLKIAEMYNRLIDEHIDCDGKRRIEFTVTRPDSILNDNPLEWDAAKREEIQARGYHDAMALEDDGGRIPSSMPPPDHGRP